MIIIKREDIMRLFRGNYEIVEDKEIVKVVREGQCEMITEEEFLEKMDGKVLKIMIYGDEGGYLFPARKWKKEEIKELISVSAASIFYRGEIKDYSWYITAGGNCDKVRKKIRNIIGGRNDNS